MTNTTTANNPGRSNTTDDIVAVWRKSMTGDGAARSAFLQRISPPSAQAWPSAPRDWRGSAAAPKVRITKDDIIAAWRRLVGDDERQERDT
jgi:hypothetical protein